MVGNQCEIAKFRTDHEITYSIVGTNYLAYIAIDGTPATSGSAREATGHLIPDFEFLIYPLQLATDSLNSILWVAHTCQWLSSSPSNRPYSLLHGFLSQFRLLGYYPTAKHTLLDCEPNDRRSMSQLPNRQLPDAN